MDNIKYLKDSLIYQMSLGSKELFHSNVWAWLIEKDKRFTNVFFPDLDLSKYKVTVSREAYHRDIIIWLLEEGYNQDDKNGHYYLVIENKIKSLPSKKQLEEYTTDIRPSVLLGAVLTGIQNTLNYEELYIKREGKSIQWDFIDYKTIAERIREITNSSKEDSIIRHKVQILEYCEIVMAIYKSLTSIVEGNNKLYNYFPELEKVRLDDIAKKLNGAAFLRHFNSILETSATEFDKSKVHIGQSFHNGNTTLTVNFSNWISDNTPWVSIGVQIEGEQYRIFAERGSSEQKCEQVYNEFLEEGWFNKKEKSKSMRNDYCKYGGKSDENKGRKNALYSFVYQYSDITKENNTYDGLSKEILSDLEDAYKIWIKKVQ